MTTMWCAANVAIFVHLLGAFQVWMQPLYGELTASCQLSALRAEATCTYEPRQSPPWEHAS